jgi:hypothetical protein
MFNKTHDDKTHDDELWKSFRCDVEEYINSENPKCDAMFMMKLVDNIFKICINEEEKDLTWYLATLFLKLYIKSFDKIESVNRKMENLRKNPIISNKYLNEKIIQMAFGYVEGKEYLLYTAKAQTISRAAKYLDKFFLPLKVNHDDVFYIGNHKYKYKKNFYDLLMSLWPNPSPIQSIETIHSLKTEEPDN